MIDPRRKFKEVIRIDQSGRSIHGWLARARTQNGPRLVFFSDKKSGGRKAALVAAIEWKLSIRDYVPGQQGLTFTFNRR